MLRRGAVVGLALLMVAAAGCEDSSAQKERDESVPMVRAYVVHHGGEAFRQIKEAFEAEAGIELNYIFACRTAMAKIVGDSRDGDVCVTSGADNLAWFAKTGLARGKPVEVAELIPIVEVMKGNPKNIESVADLARPGVRICLGREKGCLGVVASALFEKHGVAETVKANIVQRVGGEHNVAASVDGQEIDATIVWESSRRAVDPDGYEAVTIPTEKNAIDSVGAVLLNTGDNPAGAEKFVAFLQSDQARKIFRETALLRAE
ncbi:substrate-binding domain-containing protein [Planctomycetota bacterium]